MTNLIDLDAERESRAAQREGSAEPPAIRFGGEIIATLPIELPFAALTPLREVADDIGLLLSQAMRMRNAEGKVDADAAQLVVNILASAENLPGRIVDAASHIATALMGEEGMRKLLDQKPSVWDLAALAKGVKAYYGVSLGEASPSSESQTNDSGTSSTTSSPTSTGLTPEGSSLSQEHLAS